MTRSPLMALRVGAVCAVSVLALAGCGGAPATDASVEAAPSPPAPPPSPSPPPSPPPRSPRPSPPPEQPVRPPGAVEVPVRLVRLVDDAATEGFETFTATVLEDPRGWVRAGFNFVQAADAEYTVVLAEGDEVDRICHPYTTGGRFSCQMGPVVALNADRWRVATDTWPGTLDEYRAMLVNHEVGHLVGQNHPRRFCAGPGEPAAVMSQQSGGLRDCAPNPWPLDWEIACAARHEKPFAPGYEPDAQPVCGPEDVASDPSP